MQTVPSIHGLIESFRKGTAHLEAMAKQFEVPWDPHVDDPRKLHNVYAKNLFTSYVSRSSDLSHGLLSALDSKNYLIYALAGRALIEITATLRYYIFHHYKPLFDKGLRSAQDFQELIKIDDRHLRGTRFDWESFLFRNYSKLKEDAVAHLKDKKRKVKKISENVVQDQVSTVTCVEKWADQTPEVLITYNLFCDLVHPNVGSTFLVSSKGDRGLFFSRFQGELVGTKIFEESFPMLVSVTHKPFADYLLMLIGTIWEDDELPQGA